MKLLVLLLPLLLCVQLGHGAVVASAANQLSPLSQRTHYTAGVVEFRQNILGNATENLAAYLDIIDSAEATPTDIIVFPEMTLTSNANAVAVPDPNATLIAPCDEAIVYDQLLVQLSCAAKRTRKYLVVNLVEKTPCPDDAADPRPCAATGLNLYNTNVVFDRDGRVISRYRKINLYGEPRNVTWQSQIGFFDTDFGVRFGHFICFDILFALPAQDLVDAWHVRDFIFPTMWFSQLPFLTAVQFQFAWSYGNDVNLLAAGASFPDVGSTGSGIYVGRADPRVAVMEQSPGARSLLVAEVPIKAVSTRSASTQPISSPPSIEAVSAAGTEAATARVAAQPFDIRLKRDYLEMYESVPLDLSAGDQLSRELCNGNRTLCCRFELRWRTLNATSGSTYYTYRLGVYDGWRREDDAPGNLLKNCALFTCLSDGGGGDDAADIMQCGKLYERSTELQLEPQVAFEHILIETVLPRTQQHLVMPSSLLDTLMPLSVRDFVWEEAVSGSNHTVRYRLNATVNNLLTFSIYGNYFNGSPNVTDSDKDAAATAALSKVLALLVLATFAIRTRFRLY